MRIVLTGGLGFIGSHTLEALSGAGHQVAVLDRSPAPAALDVPVVQADVCDAEALDEVLRDADVVVHLAAKVGLGVDLQDLPDYTRDNMLGTATVLAAMSRAGVLHLVLASSMVVYGEGRYLCAEHAVVTPAARRPQDLDAGRFEPGCPTCGAALRWTSVPEDARLDPRSVYAASKVAQEHLAGAWAAGSGGSVLALRYHNVYGPRMPRDTPYAGVASIFLSALAAGRPPRVFEDGGQTRDFVHVRDVALANLAATERVHDVPAGALQAYNVCSGAPRTVLDMAQALARATGGPAPVVTGHYRAGDVRHVVASPLAARTGLGFVAGTDFQDGMRELAGLDETLVAPTG